MKRIKAACICQTLHFFRNDPLPNEQKAQLVRQEVEKYIEDLKRSHTQYKMIEQTEQTDGSVIVKVLKQSNFSPVGEYFN